MRIGTIINIVGVALIVFGVGFTLYATHVRSINANIQASPPPNIHSVIENEPLAQSVKQGKPVMLSIESVGINNPIIDGVFDYDTQGWTLTKDKVQFATMTRQPNDERGLTFMYGHQRKEVFSELLRIENNAIATVTTDNGYIFTYRFSNSVTVKPTDISLFSYDGPPILVLQTCTGLFFENRRLFTFDFVGVTHD